MREFFKRNLKNIDGGLEINKFYKLLTAVLVFRKFIRINSDDISFKAKIKNVFA